uniref:Uncharacterized protein n=1 Tax=Alexandrium catenella TaxID=2925 RepID=A0A7S1L030_ALECA
MPSPFAYNCMPDHSNKFSAEYFAPVRQQNNAGLIYGNGVRPEDVARHTRRASRPASHHGDEQVPMQLRGLDEADEGVVEWKSGGFTSLRKARSTGSLPKEHPSMQEARKFYPKLAARNRDGNASFRPMASRKAEAFSTHRASDEHHRIRSGKWKLAAVADGLQQATAGALEKLDLDKLKMDAMEGLRDKAKAQMRLEGISKEQQSLVLEELSSVLEEHKQIVRAKRPSLAPAAEPQAEDGPPAAATPAGSFPAAPPMPPDLGGLSLPPMAV